MLDAYSEDEAPNAKGVPEKRTVLRLDPRRVRRGQCELCLDDQRRLVQPHHLAADAFLAGGEPGEHALDPLGLFGPREPVGDQNDDALAVAVRGHRPSPALAAPHFHDRLARAGHYRLAQPSFGFTLRR